MSPQAPTPTSNGAVVNGGPSSYAARHNLPPHFIGGNSLDVAPPGPVRDFVADNDGHTPITSVRLDALPPPWRAPSRATAEWDALPRFRYSSQITALLPSKRSDPCENGPTRRSATSGLSSSPSWPRPRISAPMPTTSEWLTNTSRFVLAISFLTDPIGNDWGRRGYDLPLLLFPHNPA